VNKLILPGAVISVLAVIIVLLLNVPGAKSLSNETTTKVQTRASPCRTPIGNTAFPCQEKSPSKEEIEQQQKRASEWQERKKKLLTADYPLKSEASVDVDGDQKPDRILYQIKPSEDDFEGLLKITSANGEILWEHEFFMSSRDLVKFLVEVLDYDSVTLWVNSVFKKEADYSFKALSKKLDSAELEESRIEHAAEIYQIEPQKLKTEILSQKINRIYAYRAEWREDLLQIVYVPSLKKFVCFSRGY
jgi:hypothetical protein